MQLTCFSNDTAATGSVAATIAPKRKLCGQVQPYGKTYLVTTAVMTVPVPTPTMPSMTMCHALSMSFCLCKDAAAW